MAMLDSIKDFDRAGGLEELLRCLSVITVIRKIFWQSILANDFYLLSHMFEV